MCLGGGLLGDCVRDDGLEGSFVGGVDYLKMRGLVNQNGRFPPCVPGQTMGEIWLLKICCFVEINVLLR